MKSAHCSVLNYIQIPEECRTHKHGQTSLEMTENTEIWCADSPRSMSMSLLKLDWNIALFEITDIGTTFQNVLKHASCYDNTIFGSMSLHAFFNLLEPSWPYLGLFNSSSYLFYNVQGVWMSLLIFVYKDLKLWPWPDLIMWPMPPKVILHFVQHLSYTKLL